jgi:hypothetical protein
MIGRMYFTHYFNVLNVLFDANAAFSLSLSPYCITANWLIILESPAWLAV